MYQNRTANLTNDCMSVVRQTSMGTLIMWNVSKVLKENPHINLKSAIEATQKRLQNNMIDMITSQKPENQYLSCAILAWQQLGHSDADLYQFIENRRKMNMAGNNVAEDKWCNKKNMPLSPGSFISYYDPSVGSMNCDAVGPVVKLPVDTTRIIMRVENNPCGRPPPKKKPDKATKNKIDTACCMDSACVELLKKLDTATAELRTRAEQLARREAKRVELLEKAENAWKDLEIGYQRRLAAAQEKEEDMNKYTRKLIEERNNHKAACTTLAKQLREKTNAAEAERQKLTAMEKELYGCACERLQLTQAIGRSDAELAEAQCKSAQLDRDLMFKEEQIRCKLQNMQNDADCARALTIETERTMHSELCALREQINAVSGQLLEEDAATNAIKDELEELRQEKADIVQDLEGCQTLCTGRIQGTMEELNKKRQKLNELKDKVAECECKLPVNVGVEVKRTPSFAALCKCQPEDRLSETCSCVSLRTTLLTNLLSDLFGGLQSELGGCSTEMPCQLLMCLDDKHNWDRSTPTKTNLRNYFSKLLIGELNIAVANSIEKYHARWIGASCADKPAPPPPTCGSDSCDWQERAVERRAQKLASKLAEQLFKERADQLTEKAKEVLKSGPPPCECNPPSATAVFPVLVKPPSIGASQPNTTANSTYWRRTHKDVTQLRAQLEDLKKVSVKKEDLKVMEENIVKVVQRSVPEKATEIIKEIRKKKRKLKPSNHRLIIADPTKQQSSTLSAIRKKQFDTKRVDKNLILGLQIDKPVKPFKKHEQSYAVNVCLCSKQKGTKQFSKDGKESQDLIQKSDSKEHLKHFLSDDIASESLSVRQTKPIIIQPSSKELSNKHKFKTRPLCRSEMACFHKPPSNTSIEKLLETLAKWKGDLVKLNGSNAKGEIIDQSINTENFDKNNAKNVSTDVSTERAKICISKQIITDTFNNMEIPQDLHITTDSEYMGAINLEKSNENYCKCVTYIEPNNGQKNSNYPYKCINLDKCDCSTNIKNKEKVSSPSKVSNNESSSTNNSQNYVTNKHNNTNQFGLEPRKDIAWSNITDRLRIQNISHEIGPASNDYCITFLGVTLSNTNSKHKAFENEKKCLNVLQVNKDVNFDSNEPKSKYDNVLKATATFHEIDKTNIENKASAQRPYRAPCDCDDTYDELKSLMNNVLCKQRGDYFKNEDKCLDTQSLDNKKVMTESCVCCNVIKSDESKDLEENAFYLLEEHLKTKLEEFKSSSCKASCISAEDEERLFYTILERVKRIIIDSTNTITCKCVSGETAGGSWHRAYVLLQEYLKIKIKRVQCACTSSDRNTKLTVLPEIMDKVCNLIDKDFQRLKEICKCSNEEKDFYKRNIMHQNDIPERDNDYSQKKDNIQSVMIENKDAEISKITFSQNISSQVSSNFGIDTKSCDVMEKSNQNIAVNYSYHKCCIYSDSNKEKCLCPTTKKDTKSVDFGKTEFLVNHCIDITKDTDIFSTNTENLDLYRKTSNLCEEHDSICNENSMNTKLNPLENECLNKSMFPYIGYTVKCTCNETLGATCTCSKSTVRKNSENINSIWNTLTCNKLNRCNFSYIMDTVSKKNKETEKNLEDSEPICKTCDVTINTHCDDNTIGKDSKGNVPKSFASTSTPEENTSLQTDETIDWCDRSITSDGKHEKMNDFSDNTYDSVLYYPMNNLKNFHRSEIFAKSLSPTNLTDSLLSNCDCKMVPLCHVKMLVDSIENKLIHSTCTCESLSSKVCPVHSKTN